MKKTYKNPVSSMTAVNDDIYNPDDNLYNNPDNRELMCFNPKNIRKVRCEKISKNHEIVRYDEL